MLSWVQSRFKEQGFVRIEAGMRSLVSSFFVWALVPTAAFADMDSSAAVPGFDFAGQIIAYEYAPATIAQRLQMLAAPAPGETLGAVARLSVHASAEVRLEAVRALVRLGDVEAASRPLIAALADVDRQVQQEAVKALGSLRIKAGLPQLNAISLMTRNNDLRRETQSAIAAISGE